MKCNVHYILQCNYMHRKSFTTHVLQMKSVLVRETFFVNELPYSRQFSSVVSWCCTSCTKYELKY